MACAGQAKKHLGTLWKKCSLSREQLLLDRSEASHCNVAERQERKKQGEEQCSRQIFEGHTVLLLLLVLY